LVKSITPKSDPAALVAKHRYRPSSQANTLLMIKLPSDVSESLDVPPGLI